MKEVLSRETRSKNNGGGGAPANFSFGDAAGKAAPLQHQARASAQSALAQKLTPWRRSGPASINDLL